MKRKRFLPLLLLVISLMGCSAFEEDSVIEEDPKETILDEEPLKQNQNGSQVKLSLGHSLTVDSERHVIANKIAELVKEKSNGTIEISIYPQSQLGGEVEQIENVQVGTQGMTIVSSASLETVAIEYSLFDIPYLFDSAEQAFQILNGEVGNKFIEILEGYNIKGLGFLWPNERNIFSHKPIQTVDDLKDFKIRVMEAPGYVKTYRELEARPVPTGYGEVYLAMRQGIIDGADTPPDQFVMSEFHRVSDYYNRTKMHYVPIVVIVSENKWNLMTDQQQLALKEAMEEASSFAKEINENYYDDYYSIMEKSGIEVIDSDIESFKKATSNVYKEIVKDIPNSEVKRIHELIKSQVKTE
jgi:TRAP-type transport system periplasmic protein